jgi:hypothetical protein
MSDNINTYKETGLDDFLRNFADWDRPGFDLDQALATVKQD